MRMLRTWLLWCLVFFSVGIAFAGTWTSNEFVYKPSTGARGADEKSTFDAGMDRVDARLAKEIWIGDPNYGNTLQDAKTAIGANQLILRVPAGTHNISASLTIPANITLKLERGAILSIDTTKTLTLNGGLEAGLYQIFSCTGTGKVLFGTGTVKAVYPEWWATNATPGTTDMLGAINAALTSQSGSSIVMLQHSTYGVSGTLTLSSYKQLQGAGLDKTIIKWIGAASGTVIKFNDSPYAQFVKIMNLSVHGNSSAAVGLDLSGCSLSTFEKVIAKSFTDTGWLLNASANGTKFDTPCIYNTLRECEVYNTTGVGNYGFRLMNEANSNHLYSCLSSGPNVGYAIDSSVGVANATSTNNVLFGCSSEPSPINSVYINGEFNSVYSHRMENQSSMGTGVIFGTNANARYNTVINPCMYNIATQYSGIDTTKGNLILDPYRVGTTIGRLRLDQNLEIRPSSGDASINLIPNNGDPSKIGYISFGTSLIGSQIYGDDTYLNLAAGPAGNWQRIARIKNTATGPFEVLQKFVITNPQTPASAGATGTQGQIAWDTDYLYVCIATNTWKRVALNSW